MSSHSFLFHRFICILGYPYAIESSNPWTMASLSIYLGHLYCLSVKLYKFPVRGSTHFVPLALWRCQKHYSAFQLPLPDWPTCFWQNSRLTSLAFYFLIDLAPIIPYCLFSLILKEHGFCILSGYFSFLQQESWPKLLSLPPLGGSSQIFFMLASSRSFQFISSSFPLLLSLSYSFGTKLHFTLLLSSCWLRFFQPLWWSLLSPFFVL